MHKESICHLIAHIAYIVLYGVLIIFTIFLYNFANLMILLYAGWIILAFGIVFLLWSSKLRRKRHVEKDITKEALVENGIYAFVRHPEFLGHILIIFALIIISQHRISLIIGTILVALLYLAIIEEEKENIEKFGNVYRDYMKRVPRINLIAGIIKQKSKIKITHLTDECIAHLHLLKIFIMLKILHITTLCLKIVSYLRKIKNKKIKTTNKP